MLDIIVPIHVLFELSIIGGLEAAEGTPNTHLSVMREGDVTLEGVLPGVGQSTEVAHVGLTGNMLPVGGFPPCRFEGSRSNGLKGKINR